MRTQPQLEKALAATGEALQDCIDAMDGLISFFEDAVDVTVPGESVRIEGTHGSTSWGRNVLLDRIRNARKAQEVAEGFIEAIFEGVE